ncbi:hypothetical protein C0Q70_04053 [Pomacea canaliculata]|uniref:Uncharacterized protein n=1 Tax=Pomacea canaliculata TaxID=400727 RepID=A0A2T7PUJ1_POMCA|nr:hypothetical protein C0Q70_04053 [Pomacea canaliculata]
MLNTNPILSFYHILHDKSGTCAWWAGDVVGGVVVVVTGIVCEIPEETDTFKAINCDGWGPEVAVNINLHVRSSGQKARAHR